MTCICLYNNIQKEHLVFYPSEQNNCQRTSLMVLLVSFLYKVKSKMCILDFGVNFPFNHF